MRHAFAFGELNREHLLRHGFTDERIAMARFSVPNSYNSVSAEQKLQRRICLRDKLGIGPEKLVVAFFGKFTVKKNPELIFHALESLSPEIRSRVHLLYVGAGDLVRSLQNLAQDAFERFGTHTVFAGFVNQSALPDYYLASDIVVLPSRPMGEAWGLVINEGLQAGCSAIMTDAVGCHVEFGRLERCRVIPVEDSNAMAAAISDLSGFQRSFDWAGQKLEDYSTESAAFEMAKVLRHY
jgi:glycosyltransferase involved in cell wall biosynthesis